MMDGSAAPPTVFPHAARTLTAVTVDSYNEELREAKGFVGDRASGRAFRKILDRCRAELEEKGHEDPLGDAASREISKSKLDKILGGKDPLAAGVVHTAVEEFGQELAEVIRRFLELEIWSTSERIVIGGGLSSSHIGQLAIGRASILIADVSAVKLSAIGNHPDEAALVGAVQLAPSWVLDGHEAILAADIGGTNMRAGLVRFKVKNAEVGKAEVVKLLHWRHADDKPNREQAVEKLVAMLRELADHAVVEDLKLAPFVGIAQKLGRIGGHEPAVIMHNDAVVQGLSEVPNMRDVESWAVLTIGTGLGNAHYTNRHPEREGDAEQKSRKDKKDKKKD